MGIACKGFSCGKFREVKFNIIKTEIKDENILDKNSIGNIIRRVPYKENSVFSEADNFEINFPSEATAEEKLLILCSTMLIDYNYFENQSTFKRSAYLF